MEKMEEKYYKIYECTLTKKAKVSKFLSSFWISNYICSNPDFKKYVLIYNNSIVFGICSELSSYTPDIIFTDNGYIQDAIRSYTRKFSNKWKSCHKNILDHVLKKRLILKFFPIEYHSDLSTTIQMYNPCHVNGLSTISFARNNRDLGVIYGNCIQLTGTAEEKDFKTRLLSNLYANRENKEIIKSDNRRIICL